MEGGSRKAGEGGIRKDLDPFQCNLDSMKGEQKWKPGMRTRRRSMQRSYTNSVNEGWWIMGSFS